MKTGYDVTLIVQHDRDEVVNGVRIMALPKPRNRFTRIFGLTWRAFRLALQQHADIYHFHDPELLPWGWLLQRVTHKPVIYDVHEYYADSVLTKEWIPGILCRHVSKLVDKVEKVIAKRLAGVITVNWHMEGLFKVLNKHTITAHNYPLRNFVERIADKPPAHSLTIIYVGSLSKDRGYQIMVDAMQIVREKEPKAKCNIVGFVNRTGLPRDFLSKEEILLRKGGIALVGKVPYEEIPGFLLQSSIGWFPLLPTLNYLKSTPIKLFEYMAAKLPIVASRMGFIEEIVRENNCGLLVEPGDPKAQAETILYLFEHPDQAREMGENGRRAVLEKYNWETEGKKLLALYDGLFAQGP